MRSTILLLMTAALLASAGCGGNSLNAVQGSATLDGEPIAAGSIVFAPTAGEATKAAAAIEQGQYLIPIEEGLKPGKYRVEINWSKPTGRQIASADPGMMMEETREVVPAKYNTNSTLTVEITSGENLHNFPLTTN